MSESRGIQSIEVGGALLQALVQAARPLSLKELAHAAGMPTSKAHPYLASFSRVGLVAQDPSTGLYGLGSMALQMGLASLKQLDPIKVVTPMAEKLALEVGQSVALSVWGNHGPTVIRLIESTAPIHVNMRPGTVMDLTQTATGLAFCAWLPVHRVEAMIQAEVARLGGQAGEANRMREELSQQCAETRRRMVARALSRPIPGVNALAAPVFNAYGEAVLVMTALGPAASFSAAWDSPIATALKSFASQASQHLGWEQHAA
jgi:DNA-binding IclR family transcriptional regulator